MHRYNGMLRGGKGRLGCLFELWAPQSLGARLTFLFRLFYLFRADGILILVDIARLSGCCKVAFVEGTTQGDLSRHETVTFNELGPFI
jgi:hypothetical protein